MSSAESELPRAFAGGVLRRLRPSDLPAFQAYRALPDLGRYQGWTPMDDARAQAFLAEMAHAPLFTPGQWVQLAIAEPQSDTLVGDVGLHLSGDGRTGEVGFTLAPSAQGRGVARAAVREAVQLLVDVAGVTRVLGITDVRNTPSVRLLQAAGFELEATRQAVFRGEACTEHVYAWQPATPFADAAVQAHFDALPPAPRRRLLALREAVFATAARTDGVGPLQETLKWGEPAYLTSQSRSGSTLRIDWKPARPAHVALFVHCQTDLVEQLRTMFPDDFEFDGRRALWLPLEGPWPDDALAVCIEVVLTYHRRRGRWARRRTPHP